MGKNMNKKKSKEIFGQGTNTNENQFHVHFKTTEEEKNSVFKSDWCTEAWKLGTNSHRARDEAPNIAWCIIVNSTTQYAIEMMRDG